MFSFAQNTIILHKKVLGNQKVLQVYDFDKTYIRLEDFNKELELPQFCDIHDIVLT